MNFTPTTNSLNNINNITTIIDFFENDTLLANFRKRNEASQIKYNLNRVLMWLNSDFVPLVYREINRCDKNDITACITLCHLVYQKFEHLQALFRKRNKNCTDNEKLEYYFACKQCNEYIPYKFLQCHEHIEDALFNQFDIIPRYNSATDIIENGSTDETPNEENVSVICSESPTREITADNLFPMQRKEGCDCDIVNKVTDFKFNFSITYNSEIEQKLYRKYLLKQINLTELELYSIQIQPNNAFVCLICCTECRTFASSKMICSHIEGARHVKRKLSYSVMTNFEAYHLNWIKQELKYQIHQIYFLPFSSTEMLCKLCEMFIPYDLLENHITSTDIHKRYNTNTFYENKSYTDGSQATIHLNAKDPLKPLQSQTYKRNKSGPEKVENDKKNSNKQTQMKNSNVGNSGENRKAKPKLFHDVVESFSNRSEVNCLIEHRFLPHFSTIIKINADHIYCNCCKISLPKIHDNIIEHINSNEHINTCNLEYPTYLFYCYLCMTWYKKDQTWHHHLKQVKHQKRYQQVSGSRKNKLKEYECKVCKIIFYGDDGSLKHHTTTTTITFRKVKELTLTADIKQLLKSEKEISIISNQLVTEAYKVLEKKNQVNNCCQALEQVLQQTYPDCKVYPFGSRVSGIGNKTSDLDVFIDLGGMYYGENNQDAASQQKFVRIVSKILNSTRDQFQNVNPVPTARTPIVSVFHVTSRLDCDISFRHGLSVENTKFLRLCIRLQPITQPLILLLKRWLKFTKLKEHLTTYALSMLAIFFLQVQGRLLSVQQLWQKHDEIIIINGWQVLNFDSFKDNLKDCVSEYNGSVKEILKEFFYYYSKFPYATDVVCPLLGKTVKKSMFIKKTNEEALPKEMDPYISKLSMIDCEYFRATVTFCVQDPFDLSHNLTKACCCSTVEKFKKFCELSYKHLNETD